MEIGKVVGSVWATRKVEEINGQKLLVIDLLEGREKQQETFLVAADVIGAGIGDLVLISKGYSARLVAGDGKAIDAAIVGIVDSLDISQ